MNLLSSKEDELQKRVFLQWNDASIAQYMTTVAPKTSLFEYTVEISPSSHVEAPVKSFLYHAVPDFTACGSFDRQLSVATPSFPSFKKKV